MYQAGINPDLQVLCQGVSIIIIIVHYHHLYQARVHREIQVKYLATIHQGCRMQLLQLSLLKILEIYQHVYKVIAHTYLQVLCQALPHQRIQAHYQHLYQA